MTDASHFAVLVAGVAGFEGRELRDQLLAKLRVEKLFDHHMAERLRGSELLRQFFSAATDIRVEEGSHFIGKEAGPAIT